MMTTDEIRKKFLDFFASKGHKIVESDSVVPKDDPTVLFTTAGMQQFKRQFLGNIDDFTRAASSQKCIRTDDLDRVGKTDFHHTFFEMLGNFSFGDYFKKEAILWAWEFLTKELKIPADKLWVSVYKDDKEAEEIWLQKIKIPEEKFVRLGDKSNFWPSEAKTKGPNGPCGPCSEIFYDYGVNPNCKNKNCNPDCDCGRFSEVWNLVFTQFNRKDGGALEPLPNKNIDTGMGLERLSAVVQGVRNNFETDLFVPIIQAMDKEIHADLTAQKKRIIADHLRTIVFAIGDGIIPSNKERGSVVKSLINRSVNLVLDAGGEEKACLYKLVPTVARVMCKPYPEITEKIKEIGVLVKKGEEASISVRKLRLPEYIKIVADVSSDPEKLGEHMFKYKDTYGLSIETILDATLHTASVPKKKAYSGLKVYERKMAEQQERSRAGSKIIGDVFANAELKLDVPKTEFIGYEQISGQAKILKLFKDDLPVDEIFKNQTAKIILDKTSFYAEAGGQVGDTGLITGKEGQFIVEDTIKIADIFIHIGKAAQGTLKKGEEVKAKVDYERRMAIMRNHTATHLLQAALRKVLGSHVQQQGSVVDENRLRFDFTHPQGLSQKQKDQIEKEVNRMIASNTSVDKKEMSMDEAREKGALAFFAEKYGANVRVVSVPGFSTELCGGTHLDAIGEIGFLKIVSESAIAQGIRRIEAVTGKNAEIFLEEQKQNKIKQQEALKRKELEKDKAKNRFNELKDGLDTIMADAKKIKNIAIITHIFEAADIGMLRRLSDIVKQKEKSAIVIMGATSEGNVSVIATVTDDVIKKGIRATDIVNIIAPLMNGSGGGRPQMAQAGSKDVSKLNDAIQEAKTWIKGML